MVDSGIGTCPVLVILNITKHYLQMVLTETSPMCYFRWGDWLCLDSVISMERCPVESGSMMINDDQLCLWDFNGDPIIPWVLRCSPTPPPLTQLLHSHVGLISLDDGPWIVPMKQVWCLNPLLVHQIPQGFSWWNHEIPSFSIKSQISPVNPFPQHFWWSYPWLTWFIPDYPWLIHGWC